MAVTKLKRKTLRNRLKPKNKAKLLKHLTSRPTIKHVDVEAIKASFAKKGDKQASKEDKKAADAPAEKESKQKDSDSAAE